jgi:hypothetical protein
MLAMWTVEATIYGRLIEVTSDGTEAGTTYRCDSQGDAELISGFIHYGKSFQVTHTGPIVKCAYTPMGIMASIAGIAEGHAIFTKLPDEAIKELDAFCAPRLKLWKKYRGRIAF